MVSKQVADFSSKVSNTKLRKGIFRKLIDIDAVYTNPSLCALTDDHVLILGEVVSN